MAHYDIIIESGQSNAGGFGVTTELPESSSDSPFTEYALPTSVTFPCLWNSINDPGNNYNLWGSFLLHERGSTIGGTLFPESAYGPELSYCWKWKARFPSRNLAIVKCVAGGTPIGEWLEGGFMYDALTLCIEQAEARLIAAGHTYEWHRYLFIHGESGAANHITGEYAADLREHLAYIRSITSPTLKCGIARMGNHMLADGSLESFGASTEGEKSAMRSRMNERRAEQWDVGTDANNFRWSQDDLPVLDPDGEFPYHHTGPGYLADGERMFAADFLPPKRRLGIKAGGRLLLQTGVV